MACPKPHEGPTAYERTGMSKDRGQAQWPVLGLAKHRRACRSATLRATVPLGELGDASHLRAANRSPASNHCGGHRQQDGAGAAVRLGLFDRLLPTPCSHQLAATDRKHSRLQRTLNRPERRAVCSEFDRALAGIIWALGKAFCATRTCHNAPLLSGI